MPFIIGVDLGQAQDYTAVAVVERLPGPTRPPGTEQAPRSRRPQYAYHLRYLARPELGTLYPVIVAKVAALLGSAPLSLSDPLVVDKTGVGAAVCDMFTTLGGVRPRAVTITGGVAVTKESPYVVTVPKRDLVGNLVALYQTGQLKMADGLELAPALIRELINFKLKQNLETGHDSYEAWRESIHDDLVLAVALACWWGENMMGRPFTSAGAGERPGMAAAAGYSARNALPGSNPYAGTKTRTVHLP